MKLETCPDDAQLKAHVLGQTGDVDTESLDEHLQSCAACVVRADEMYISDPLISALACPPVDFGCHEDAISEIIARASTLKGERDTTHHNTPSTESQSTSKLDISFLSPAQEEDEIGRLGEFRILEVLGAGGMGVVFRAEDSKLNREVALKVMKPEVAAWDSAKQRFLREARATAAIEHDNIVTVYQVDEDQGIPYLAMPFLKGESLKDRLERDQKLPIHDILTIGKEVAAGLAAAHAAGLIHRDIKPDNIWLEDKSASDPGNPDSKSKASQRCRVKIVDFGLARADDDIELTKTGWVMGTPPYMSPEQAQGEATDHRTDLFSLGVVLYQLATGLGPFDRNSLAATLLAVINDEPPPLVDVRDDLPDELSSLIHRMLRKHVAERPQSADKVVRAIQRIDKDGVSNPNSRMPKQKSNDFCFTPIAPQSLSQRGRKRSRPVLFMFAVLAPFLLLMGIMLLFDTPEGKLRVEVNGEDLEVLVDGETIKLKNKKWEGKKERKPHQLALKVGGQGIPFDPETQQFVIENGMLSISLDDTELRAKTFELSQDQTTVLKIDFIPIRHVSQKQPQDFRINSAGKTVQDPNTGWTSLFDGRSLSGWDGEPGFWRVENGAIVGEGKSKNSPSHNTCLVWKGGDVADFELELEYQLDSGNSGVQFRSFRVLGGNQWRLGGYLADIDRYNGGIYGEESRGILANRGEKVEVDSKGTSNILATFESPEEIERRISGRGWKQLRIVAVGNHITQYINELKTSELIDNDLEAYGRRMDTGKLGLHLHRGKHTTVRFRNIRLKKLDGTLAENDSKGITTEPPIEFATKTLPSKSSTSDQTRIRQIAERLFESGGYVSFINHNHKAAFRTAELPADDFQINFVGFADKRRVIDGRDISVLSELPNLRIVSFGQTRLTAAAVSELAKLQCLEELHFKKMNLTNEFLSQLTVLKNLEMIEIFHTELTNDGLKTLAEFPGLRRLTLENAAKKKFGEAIINDDGLVHLSKIKNLEVLWLMGPNFTDAAVEHLLAIKSLTGLSIGAEDMTAAGIDELKRRLHK